MLRPAVSGPPLQAFVDTARSTRALQRVLFSAAEGLGRSHALNLLHDMPVLRVELSRGSLVSQTLRALLGEAADDEAALHAITTAPALANLEPDRATVAAELLASLLGIRQATFRTARLDEDSRREGAFLELARWLTERAQQGDGLVVAFDDAHLSSDDGVAFIELLSQREEPAPMVLLVSHDADRERFTPAFRARCDGWRASSTWARVELPLPSAAEVEQLLVSAGAPTELAVGLTARAKANPGLALGLWSQVRGADAVNLADLPATLDGVRLARVKALGDEVLRACATLGALGGAVPLAALSAISPELPVILQPALASGVVRMSREGQLELCRLADPRLAMSLRAVLPPSQLIGARLAAGAWAAQALEQLELPAFARLADVLVPLASPALDGVTSSYWYEALAMTRPGGPDAWLEAAVESAVGVRRLVLLRRIAEVKLFLGLPDAAIAVVASAGRPSASPPRPLPLSAVGRVLAAQHRGVLDRWESLTLDEAMAALELVRAESISYLVKKEDTQKAFTELEKRLTRLKGSAVPHLWIRWAKGWSWFLCEILGRSPEAMRVCALVRRHVSEAQLAADEDAIAFVRAEEVATCSVGQFTRAMALTGEHIALAERAGKLRDACLGWNARAIVHFGQGDLPQARKAFERSLELARSTGWLRREAITLHNLSLVLTELGELDLAFAGETAYARLSVLVGNHAGKAEAPLVLAAVELARGRLVEAEAQLATARKVAEQNGWDMLATWSRALTGRLRLARVKAGGDPLEVTKAKNDLMAAIEVAEERSVGWTEEFDPGEVVADFALALKWSGQAPAAREVIARTVARLPEENIVSRKQLELALDAVEGRSDGAALAWFEERGFKRRVARWR